MKDTMGIHGVYTATFKDRFGKGLRKDEFPNTVVTVGKNALFNSGLVTSAVTLVGPYMGLISSVGYSAISASDTMASHAGWKEADSTNAPAYTIPGTTRATVTFGAPSAGATSITAIVFTFTGNGTVEGAFMLFAASATNVWEATTGTLLSAGIFSGGSQAVVSTNTLTVSYSISM